MMRFKILVIGDTCCGKTQFLRRVVGLGYDPSVGITIGVDYFQRVINFHQLDFYDTSGPELFHRIAFSYYRDCDAIIIMMDLTSQENNALRWLENCHSHTSEAPLIYWLGSKADDLLEMTHNNKLERLMSMAPQGTPPEQCFLVDAQTGLNIEEFINKLYRELPYNLRISRYRYTIEKFIEDYNRKYAADTSKRYFPGWLYSSSAIQPLIANHLHVLAQI